MRTKVRDKQLADLEREAAEETGGVFAGDKGRPLSKEAKQAFADDIRQREQKLQQKMKDQ